MKITSLTIVLWAIIPNLLGISYTEIKDFSRDSFGSNNSFIKIHIKEMDYCPVLKQKQNEIIIPMDLSFNRPVIELLINSSGPYKFILDTGAGGNVIDSEVAEALGLSETGQIEVGSPGSDVKTLVPQVNIPKISISSKEFKNLSMIKMNLRNMIPVDGILSYKEFSDYLININFPGEKIVLKKGELKKRDIDVIALLQESEILTIELEVSRKKWKAHLDTGSPFFISFPYSAKDDLNLQSPLVELPGRSRTVTMSHKNWKAGLNDNILLANIIYESPDIILSERNNETVNIGYQLLKELSITLDLKKQLIKFYKPKTSKKTDKRIETNDKLGISGRYGGSRSITYEKDHYFIQRDGSIKLELIITEDGLYMPTLPKGMKAMNPLPKLRFERDDNGNVKGFTFIHNDGREEFLEKDDK